MQLDFTGRVALVTGGARDIGRGVCQKLAEGGASIVVNYNRSEAQAEETVRAVEAVGGLAVAVQADVTNRGDVDRLVAATQEAFGDAIHILVNNAGGIIARKPFDEIDDAFWDRVMDVNLRSVLYVTQAVLPYMPSGGAIVNNASLAARNGGGSGAIAYATSKGAVLTLTRGLAKELGPRNIRVNCVSPGLIDTTFHDEFTADEVRAKAAAATPLRREGTSEEVGAAIAYLASDAASFVTGESLEINGGLYFS
ncbi:MAG: 3-oxoacyl-ACP reductase family protein [Rhodothermales bacterium]